MSRRTEITIYSGIAEQTTDPKPLMKMTTVVLIVIATTIMDSDDDAFAFAQSLITADPPVLSCVLHIHSANE